MSLSSWLSALRTHARLATSCAGSLPDTMAPSQNELRRLDLSIHFMCARGDSRLCRMPCHLASPGFSQHSTFGPGDVGPTREFRWATPGRAEHAGRPALCLSRRSECVATANHLSRRGRGVRSPGAGARRATCLRFDCANRSDPEPREHAGSSFNRLLRVQEVATRGDPMAVGTVWGELVSAADSLSGGSGNRCPESRSMPRRAGPVAVATARSPALHPPCRGGTREWGGTIARIPGRPPTRRAPGRANRSHVDSLGSEV